MLKNSQEKFAKIGGDKEFSRNPELLEASFLKLINKNFNLGDILLIEKAVKIMKEAHKNQFRDECDSYIVHPIIKQTPSFLNVLT